MVEVKGPELDIIDVLLSLSKKRLKEPYVSMVNNIFEQHLKQYLSAKDEEQRKRYNEQSKVNIDQNSLVELIF
jgi:hypothetical protein